MINIESFFKTILTVTILATSFSVNAQMSCQSILSDRDSLQVNLDTPEDLFRKELIIAFQTMKGTDSEGRTYNLSPSDLVEGVTVYADHFSFAALPKEATEILSLSFNSLNRPLTTKELVAKALVEFNLDRNGDGPKRALEILNTIPENMRSNQMRWHMAEIFHFTKETQMAVDLLLSYIDRGYPLSQMTVAAINELSQIKGIEPLTQKHIDKINEDTDPSISVHFDSDGQWGPFVELDPIDQTLPNSFNPTSPLLYQGVNNRGFQGPQRNWISGGNN